MFWAEMKKIWGWKTVVLLAGFSVLFFYSFLYQWVKPFLMEARDSYNKDNLQEKEGLDDSGGSMQRTEGVSYSEDSLQVKMEILSGWVSQYGNEIDEAEFQEIERGYQEMLYEARFVIGEDAFFRENGVYDYEGYLAYMNGAVSGKDGYDYDVYRKMRRLIAENTGRTPVYFQEYESVLQQYRQFGDGRESVLPPEVFVYANRYFVNLMILCLVCVFFLSGFVMADDRENDMVGAQYLGKAGRRIYLIQYGCMAASAVLAVSVIVGAALFVWRATGTFVFAESEIASFLNTGDLAAGVTYGEYMAFFVLMTYLLGLGIGSIVFCLSARSGSVISMLPAGIPALIGGGVIAFGVQDVFSGKSLLCRVFGWGYCEVVLAAAVLVVGIGVNLWNYRGVCRKDCG